MVMVFIRGRCGCCRYRLWPMVHNRQTHNQLCAFRHAVASGLSHYQLSSEAWSEKGVLAHNFRLFNFCGEQPDPPGTNQLCVQAPTMHLSRTIFRDGPVHLARQLFHVRHHGVIISIIITPCSGQTAGTDRRTETAGQSCAGRSFVRICNQRLDATQKVRNLASVAPRVAIGYGSMMKPCVSR